MKDMTIPEKIVLCLIMTICTGMWGWTMREVVALKIQVAELRAQMNARNPNQ